MVYWVQCQPMQAMHRYPPRHKGNHEDDKDVCLIPKRESRKGGHARKMFTRRELSAMIEEYQKTTKARKEYLSMMWEIAKEEYLDGIRQDSK